jgi:hypothetical protein
MARRKNPSDGKWTTQERLELFVERADELRDLRLVQDMWNWEYAMRWNPQSGYNLELPGQDADARRSFASLFRQFLMNDEPINVGRICSYLDSHLADDHVKQQVRTLRKRWNNVLQGRTGGQLVLKGKELTPQHVLDLWFNGAYMHSRPTATLQLRELQNLELPIGELALLYHLPVLTEIVLSLSDIVSSTLKQGLFNMPPEAAVVSTSVQTRE